MKFVFKSFVSAPGGMLYDNGAPYGTFGALGVDGFEWGTTKPPLFDGAGF